MRPAQKHNAHPKETNSISFMQMMKSVHRTLLTFPANGIRNGSVQNIPRLAKAIREVLTAIDNSIGSSGGITEVTISEQLRISLYLLLKGSSSP